MRPTHPQRIAAPAARPGEQHVVRPFARPLAANDDHFDLPLLVGGSERADRLADAPAAAVDARPARALARRVLGFLARLAGS